MSLKRNLESTAMLKSTFEERYHKIKKEMAESKEANNARIASLEMHNERLQADNSTSNECLNMMHAEIDVLKHSHHQALIACEAKNRSSLTKLLDETNEKIKIIDQERNAQIQSLNDEIKRSKEQSRNLRDMSKLAKRV